MLFPAKQRICPSVHPDLCLATIPSGGRAFGRMGQFYMGRANPFGGSCRDSPATSSCYSEGPLARDAAASRSPPGSPSSGPCALTPPSSARPSCAVSPTRRPSSSGTACSPRYPATGTGSCCATPFGWARATSTTRPLQGLRAAPQARPIPPEALHLRRHQHLK